MQSLPPERYGSLRIVSKPLPVWVSVCLYLDN